MFSGSSLLQRVRMVKLVESGGIEKAFRVGPANSLLTKSSLKLQSKKEINQERWVGKGQQ